MSKAVIFDLDGTLWETIDSTYAAINEVANKHQYGQISREIVCSNYGNNKSDSAKLFFPKLSPSEAFKLLDESGEINIKNLTTNGGFIYPRLEETLFKLHEKYDLYIVSNTATKKYIEAFLVSSKLFKYFKDYIAASEIMLSKGNAIIKLIDDYYIGKSVYVGDTKKDYEAAMHANIPFIQCLYGFGEDLRCKYKVNNVYELCDVVDAIFSDLNTSGV